MAPRTYAGKPQPQRPRALKPSSSTDVHSRILQPSSRVARTGTITQLETITPNASPRTRYSPTSKGNILLAAADRVDLGAELHYSGSPANGNTSDASSRRFIPTRQGDTEALELPEIDNDSPPEEVENMIEHMTDYLAHWSCDDLVEGPASLFTDMRLIMHHLDDIRRLPNDVISSHVIQKALAKFMRWYQRFVDVWSQAVNKALVYKLSQLKTYLNRRPTAVHEALFTLLWSQIDTVSLAYPFHELLGSSPDSISFLLSSGAAEELSDRLDGLNLAFQTATYESEQKELWLLIWLSLRTAFRAFERGGAPTSPTNTLRDRNFFDIPGIHRELKRITGSPDAANPRSIEDIVGKYCQYIYRCQVDTGNKYESLQRPQDTPLESHTKNALRDFILTGNFETSTLSKIHFAVARLNKINGGPVRVRRWKNDFDDGVWEIIPLDLPSSPSTQSLPEFKDYDKVQQGGNVNHPSTPRSPSFVGNIQSARPLKDTTEKPAKRIFPYPEGVNMKSAFDYVYYPFPETRAHEVVQSEQISREMAQPEIFSEGPRPECLINRPPRHARDPADHPRRALGPFTWMRLVIQHLLSKPRRVPDVKKPSFSKFPSRQDRKILSSETRSAILDRTARAHKSTSSNPGLRLRGGGPHSTHPGTGRSRRHAFDHTAFHRKMVEMAVRELKSKLGRSVPIDEVEIKELLKRTVYNMEEMARRYQAPGRGKVSGLIKKGNEELGMKASKQAVVSQSRRQHPSYGVPVAEGAEIYEYRVDNTAPRHLVSEDAIYEDEDVAEDQDPGEENRDPAPPRRPLGEIPPGDYPDARDDRDRGSSNPPLPPIAPVHDLEEIVTRAPYIEASSITSAIAHMSPPSPPDLPNSPEDPFFVYPDRDPDGFNEDDNDQNEEDQNEDKDQNGEDDVQNEEQNEEQNDSSSPAPSPSKRPRREKPHPDDDRDIQDVFGEQTTFKTSLNSFGKKYIRDIQQHFNEHRPIWTTDAANRHEVMSHLDEMAKQMRKLRSDYLGLLTQDPEPFVETIPNGDSRASNPDHPATSKLCVRAFSDMKQHYVELGKFFDYGHRRANLGFRHQLNAFIVALRELRRLLQEYHSLADKDGAAGKDNGDETDAETWSTLSTLETERLKNWKPKPRIQRKPVLPTREEYELMFHDELERELRVNRGIGDIEATFGKKKPLKTELINKLMELDQQGKNFGKGATEGYRYLTGNKQARARPRDFKLDKAIARDNLDKANADAQARKGRRNARHEAKKAKGMKSPPPLRRRSPTVAQDFSEDVSNPQGNPFGPHEEWYEHSQESEESETVAENIHQGQPFAC